MSVTVIVGAQFGSEGKGSIVNAIAADYSVHVRTGGPNAGHTIYHEGKQYKMQVLPCGWTNHDAQLVIGRGAVVDVKRLLVEMGMLDGIGYSVLNRLHVDPEASILSQDHHHIEGGVNGLIHQEIGSTGEGVGACRMDRMARRPGDEFMLAKSNDKLSRIQVLGDTIEYLHEWDREGVPILLEGTQGAGLSLIHGHWPYVTSADTTSGQFMVDAGLHPHMMTECILVARTYPIRVAGNSGPLEDEITWDELSDKMGKPIIETTTVTGKVRRVGLWNEQEFLRACQLNGPTQIAINFIDYLSPEDEGLTSYDDLSATSKQFIEYLERLADCPVTMVGTGGPECVVIRR